MCIDTSAHNCTWSNLLSPSHGRDSSWVWHFLLLGRNDSGREFGATGSCRLCQETNSLIVCVALWKCGPVWRHQYTPFRLWVFVSPLDCTPKLTSTFSAWIVQLSGILLLRITSDCLTLLLHAAYSVCFLANIWTTWNSPPLPWLPMCLVWRVGEVINASKWYRENTLQMCFPSARTSGD